MAKFRYEYPADVAFKTAARSALMGAFHLMVDNAPGTEEGLSRRDPTEEDIEFLHDMRVGSRRLRAALSVFGSVFSKRDMRDIDREVGKITDALGAVRDLDVHIDALRRVEKKLPLNEAYGVGRLIERQTEERDKQRLVLLAELERMRRRGFAERFEKLLNKALPEATTETDTRKVA